MAGRPAARGGGGGTLYGMITFVILSVVFLGLFIWQFTYNKRLQEEAESAQRRMNQMGRAPSYYQDEASSRGTTVIGAMQDDLERLATLVAGKKDAVFAAIQDDVDRLLGEIAEDHPQVLNPKDTLISALSKLYRAFREERQNVEQLQSDLAALRQENENLSEGVKLAREEFEAQVAELKEELARLEQEKSDQLAAKDEQVAALQASNDSLTEELNRMRVETLQSERLRDVEIARLERQKRELEQQLAEVNPSEFDPYKILTKADGRILRAIPGSDIVFINIGAAQRVKPGLTFEVFSPYGERSTDIRGKASVEVTSVTEDTAECKINRRTAGRPIVEGDLIVNIAFEPNRKPKFVIRGEFDLNYDNVRDFDGVDRVSAIVRAWGGEVVEDVDQSTDFVVLGMGPQVPSMLNREQVSSVFQDLVQQRQDELSQYEDVIQKARAFNVPIVTQNQFLFLTGFAGREDIVRR